MNRQIESRASKKPSLTDLRESGDIEQDCDYVGFLIPEDLKGKNLSGDAWADVELYLEKNQPRQAGDFSIPLGSLSITAFQRWKRDMDKWLFYEAAKRKLQEMNLTNQEYERRIRKLVVLIEEDCYDRPGSVCAGKQISGDSGN